MSKKPISGRRGETWRVSDVRFAEVDFDPPSRRGVVVELEGGVRLLVGEDDSLELAAALINRLRDLEAGGGR